MTYAEHIKMLLKPLGIYELEKGLSAAEIEAAGEVFDGIDSISQTLDAESTAATAEGYGLEVYERILPNKPVFKSTQFRRDAICALLSVDETSFTAEALNRSLAGCGIPATVTETDEKYVVAVSFPGTKGIPDEIAQLKRRIEDILPCHLGVEYIFVYLTWEELEEYFNTWDSIETAGISWKALEGYGSI